MESEQDQKAWKEKDEKKEYEKMAENWERRRAEMERFWRAQGQQGGRRQGGGMARPSRIPRYVCVPGGSSSRLDDGSVRGLNQASSMCRRGGVGTSSGASLHFRTQGATRQQEEDLEEDVEEDDVLGEGIGGIATGVAMSSTFASSLMTPTADVFGPLPPILPSASTGVQRLEIPARFEASPAVSSSHRPTFSSVARLGGGLSDDDSILAPTPPRYLCRTPVGPRGSPDNLLPPPRLGLPDSFVVRALSVTPGTRQEEETLAESLKQSQQRAKYHFSSRGNASSSSPTPPLPALPSRFVSIAAAAAAPTNSTTITKERAFGAGSVVGAPETLGPATPTAFVEGKSWWIHTPSPSPTKMSKMAVRAAKSLGNLRAKFSRANLGGVGDDETVSEAVPPASTSGSVRLLPHFPSSSPNFSTGGRGSAVTDSYPSSQETGCRRQPQLRLSALAGRTLEATSSSGGLLDTSSPQVASVGLPPPRPPRPPRPSEAEVAATFALLGDSVSPGVEHRQQQQEQQEQQQRHHYHRQPSPQPLEQQPVHPPVTSVLPAAIAIAQQVPSSLLPLPSSVPGPSTTTLKKKKSFAAFLFGRKEKRDK
ncbi:hypothetical protein QBC42DRAFT_291271 [Cladorrhinum samala]|uniref:Proteophosphoglycan ppg4 n=1 Tax=Cladorrhinum samala TaxID=585594 RepID=A0AAV9HDA3_9PEZI|nr:hypothetical protein QBC42DRAFT_291271 [Cladorrhinum samala]